MGAPFSIYIFHWVGYSQSVKVIMQRILLSLILSLTLASPALADDDLHTLLDCFRAQSTSIAPRTWPREETGVVMLEGSRAGRRGFYAFTDSMAYFLPLPLQPSDGVWMFHRVTLPVSGGAPARTFYVETRDRIFEAGTVVTGSGNGTLSGGAEVLRPSPRRQVSTSVQHGAVRSLNVPESSYVPVRGSEALGAESREILLSWIRGRPGESGTRTLCEYDYTEECGDPRYDFHRRLDPSPRIAIPTYPSSPTEPLSRPTGGTRFTRLPTTEECLNPTPYRNALTVCERIKDAAARRMVETSRTLLERSIAAYAAGHGRTTPAAPIPAPGGAGSTR